MMYFEKYVSNTLAGSSNQCFFVSDGQSHKGRVFYKIFEKGQYNYSFLFSNIIDSTFGDGSVSQKNMLCGEWVIENLRVACCESIDNSIRDDEFKSVTFDGKTVKNIASADIFASDPVSVAPSAYICLEIAFRGEIIPCHKELVISAFSSQNGSWVEDSCIPVPSMVGCDRAVKGRIAFLGDSITQGCGTTKDSYTHWNSIFAEMLGNDFSYWNIGIGCGRAGDAASDGIWLQKAKQNDIIFVCFGVNDILQGASEKQICLDIQKISTVLKQNGLTVILQTVPPFDYSGEDIQKWKKINEYIMTELCDTVDMVFDTVPVLGKSKNEPHIAAYNGHPNAKGCQKWAEKLYEAYKNTIG